MKVIEPENGGLLMNLWRWVTSRAAEKGLLVGLAIMVWRAISVWIGLGPGKGSRERPGWMHFTMWLLAFGAVVVVVAVLGACAVASGPNSQAWGVNIGQAAANLERRINSDGAGAGVPVLPASAASAP